MRGGEMHSDGCDASRMRWQEIPRQRTRCDYVAPRGTLAGCGYGSVRACVRSHELWRSVQCVLAHKGWNLGWWVSHFATQIAITSCDRFSSQSASDRGAVPGRASRCARRERSQFSALPRDPSRARPKEGARSRSYNEASSCLDAMLYCWAIRSEPQVMASLAHCRAAMRGRNGHGKGAARPTANKDHYEGESGIRAQDFVRTAKLGWSEQARHCAKFARELMGSKKSDTSDSVSEN